MDGAGDVYFLGGEEGNIGFGNFCNGGDVVNKQMQYCCKQMEICRLTFGKYVRSSGFEFNISFLLVLATRDVSICFDTAVVRGAFEYMTGSLQRQRIVRSNGL